jgi:hypothetical protein
LEHGLERKLKLKQKHELENKLEQKLERQLDQECTKCNMNAAVMREGWNRSGSWSISRSGVK